MTLANPFSPARRGRQAIVEALEYASGRMRDGKITSFDELARYVAEDLATMLEVEHWQSRIGDNEDITPFDLRVTTTFARRRRLENRPPARRPDRDRRSVGPAAGTLGSGGPGKCRVDRIERAGSRGETPWQRPTILSSSMASTARAVDANKNEIDVESWSWGETYAVAGPPGSGGEPARSRCRTSSL